MTVSPPHPLSKQGRGRVGYISARGGSRVKKCFAQIIISAVPCSLFPFNSHLSTPPSVVRPCTDSMECCLYFLWLWLCCWVFMLLSLSPRQPLSHNAPGIDDTAIVFVRLFTFCSHCLQSMGMHCFFSAHMLIYEISVDILAMRVNWMSCGKHTHTHPELYETRDKCN